MSKYEKVLGSNTFPTNIYGNLSYTSQQGSRHARTLGTDKERCTEIDYQTTN